MSETDDLNPAFAADESIPAKLKASQFDIIEGEPMLGVASRHGYVNKTKKSVITRERIMNAACALMLRRGGTDFQMADIADYCNMSKGSLYYYFKDRDALIDAAFSAASAELIEAMNDAITQAENSIAALVNIVIEISNRLHAGSPIALALLHDLALSDPSHKNFPVEASMLRVIKAVSTQLERGINEGDFIAGINCEMVATFITGGFNVSFQMSRSYLGASEHSDVAELIQLALKGLLTEKGQALLTEVLAKLSL